MIIQLQLQVQLFGIEKLNICTIQNLIFYLTSWSWFLQDCDYDQRWDLA